MTGQPRSSGFATLAIHAGLRSEPTPHAATACATRHAFDSEIETSDARRAAGRREPNGEHAATAMLEERVAALEGGSAAVAVATGAGALVLTLHTLIQPGEELVVASGASLSRPSFESFGWRVRSADPDRAETFVEALSDKTKAILIESLGRPDGAVTDIEAIATIARRARVPLVVDNTLATPFLVRPSEHGADIIVHSSTRSLAGQGSDAGLIIDCGAFDWLQDERYPSLSKPQPVHGDVAVGEAYGNFAFAVACRTMAGHGLGPLLSPAEALFVLSGIETLALRMQRHSDSALAVAQHLARHNAVARVRYAGLVDDPRHALALRYCPKGAGPLLSFGVSGERDTSAFLTKLRLFSRSPDLGMTRSHVVQQAPDLRDDGGGSGTVIVSIGLEDAADIIADLDQALGT